MAIKYNLVRFEGQENITVVLDGEMYVADNNHPNWLAIVDAVENEREEGLADLFDTQRAIQNKFKKISERVSVANGKVTFDGDVQDNSLTEQILRFMEEGVDDWKPLVAFMEKVMNNPKKRSRKQLFDWLQNNAFTITTEGDILGYKGMYRDGEYYLSVHSGDTIVNGVELKNQQTRATIGDVVEMPRSAVNDDPSTGCSTGLHISNFEYSGTYGNVRLLVKVNPRDVVSVPNEHQWQKVRACRYEIIEETQDEVTEAVYEPKHAAPVVADPEPVQFATVTTPLTTMLNSLADAFASAFAGPDDTSNSWADDGGYLDDDEDSWS